MNPKTRNIIGWTLTVLLALLFIWSAVMKLVSGDEKMVQALGISMQQLKVIGVVELLSILLFVYPRTGLLGTLLLSAYMGGAIATHVEHAMPILAPVIVQCIVWITATIRFPELSRRLMGSHTI